MFSAELLQVALVEDAFFCQLRSITLRSNRVKQRRDIKAMEMESQLNQIPSEITLIKDFPSSISRIIEDIASFDLDFRNSFLGGNLQCINCKTKFSVGLFETIHIQRDSKSPNVESIEHIAGIIEEKIARTHESMSNSCKNLELDIEDKKILVVTIEGENKVRFSDKIKLMDETYKVMSFSSISSTQIEKTTFRSGELFYTTENGSTPQLTNLEETSKINVALFVKENIHYQEDDLDQFIFKKNSLDTFSKEAIKFTNREKYEEMREKRATYERARDKTDKRKLMHQTLDEVRDKTEKRIKMHQTLDKVRDETEKRKLMHQAMN